MLGVIGGTGLYKLEQLKIEQTLTVETPFGPPSAPIVTGQLGAQKIAFLPRHGLQHELLPSEINFRANIFALKKIGARSLIGVSAVGSLKKEIAPGDLALPNQYIDLTRGRRVQTFFGNGVAAHVSTADPICQDLAKLIFAAAEKTGVNVHRDVTYACVEGPRLGTRAESHHMRLIGCGLVGMTNVPEVFLAREAQLPYATLCIATDYDCWLEDPAQHAQVDKIMELYAANVSRVKAILTKLCENPLPNMSLWPTRQSLKYALLTNRDHLPPGAKEWLSVLEL